MQTPGVLSCAFFSGMASRCPISNKAQMCEVLQRLLSFRQFLPSQPRNSVIVSEWSLGSWSPPWPRTFSCPVVQFGQTASSRKSLGSFIFFPFLHFLMMELTVLLGTFNTPEIVLHPSPDLSLLTFLSQSSTYSSLDLMGEFLLWHAQSTVGPCIERCVSF